MYVALVETKREMCYHFIYKNLVVLTVVTLVKPHDYYTRRSPIVHNSSLSCFSELGVLLVYKLFRASHTEDLIKKQAEVFRKARPQLFETKYSY